MELATEATAFLSQVLGKSVAEQAAAGNAEGWKATAMLSSVKTYKDLLTILKFAATVNTTAGNEKMQAAYEKYGQVVADVGHMDDPAKIEEVKDLVVEAFQAATLPISATIAKFADYTGSPAEPQTSVQSPAQRTAEDPDMQQSDLPTIKGDFMDRNSFAEKHLRQEVPQISFMYARPCT